MSRMIALLFGFFVIISTQVFAERHYEIYDASTGEKLTMKEFAKRSIKNDIIFFGEFHDDSLLHNIQKEYLTAMYDENDDIAVSLEMFERDVQPYIDKYIKGEITEEEFLKNSRPWGDYKNFYKPLVELAKSHKAPVLASNIPRKYAALYTREGWPGIEKLPENERNYIAKTLSVKNDEYEKNFNKTMLQGFGMDTNTVMSPNEENTLYLYYGAQCLKDETMAESILNQWKKDDDYKIVHFNGDFHSNNYLGTVQKVRDRNKEVKIAIITPAYADSGKAPDFDKSYTGKTNFIIVMDAKPKDFEITQSMMGGHIAENYIVNHDINIKLKPDQHYIEGTDKISFYNPIAKRCNVRLLKDLKVQNISSQDGPLVYNVNPIIDDTLFNEITILAKGKELTSIDINYDGIVNHSPDVILLNQRHSNTPGIISGDTDKGIYLPGGSYCPKTNKDIASFDVSITLPKDFTVITSGTFTVAGNPNNAGEHTYHYKSELPLDDMILVGGRYIEKDTTYDGKKFSLYTFNPSPAGDAYLKASIEYYKLYTKLMGSYAFSSFSIVENFFASGFGMPGYTLLSNRLMALPWVVLSPGSLAHEFVHNWWGNSVYVDDELGNWCEALTTFCANYYYNVLTDKKDKSLDWRKKALLSIETLPEKSNYPLRKFKYQKNNDDATIGYQKGGFMFYEIYKLLGEERFFDALKKFAKKFKGKRAYWFSLSTIFEEEVKNDSLKLPISKIMNQWLDDKYIPTLKLDNVKLENDSLRFEINQDLDFYESVPVKINTVSGEQWLNFTITGKTNKFAIKPGATVKSILVDPDYQVLRHLNKWEVPYSFGRILAEKSLLILPAKKSKEYKVLVKFADMVKESGYDIGFKPADELAETDWADTNIIVIGDTKSNPFFKQIKKLYPENISVKDTAITIADKKYSANENIMLLNTAHPVREGRLMTIIYSRKIGSTEPLRRLFHYLSYSMVLLDKAKIGKPLADMEIFPNITDKFELQYYFMCDK